MLEPIGVPPFYKDIFEKYFNYIVDEFNKNDHGIYAAFQLFSDLCYIRENEFIRQQCLGVKASPLCWEEPLVNIYNYASWIILAHNIWYVNEDDNCNSKRYRPKLNSLILKKNERKININDHPFFFLFCLVDSIEPYKLVKVNNLLDKIQIELTNNELIIESNLECGCHKVLLNKATNLNDWLTVSKRINDNSVRIQLKSK